MEEQESEIPDGVSNPKAAMWIAIGLVLLPISAGLLVDNAVIIAKFWNEWSCDRKTTIIAVGTSLPELTASVAGVLKGEDDMAVGNIVGSNVFNILAVMGIPAFWTFTPEWTRDGTRLWVVGVSLSRGDGVG